MVGPGLEVRQVLGEYHGADRVARQQQGRVREQPLHVRGRRMQVARLGRAVCPRRRQRRAAAAPVMNDPKLMLFLPLLLLVWFKSALLLQVCSAAPTRSACAVFWTPGAR